MLRKPIVIAAIVVSTLVIIGTSVVVWVIFANRANAPAVVIEYTDLTASSQVDVKMSNLSFTPPNIKVKKGATVTWTNQDSVGHNVVADDATNAGGLPTDHPVFGRGGSYAMTFKEVGTFHYHCAAHSFMKGTVEVVE